MLTIGAFPASKEVENEDDDEDQDARTIAEATYTALNTYTRDEIVVLVRKIESKHRNQGVIQMRVTARIQNILDVRLQEQMIVDLELVARLKDGFMS